MIVYEVTYMTVEGDDGAHGLFTNIPAAEAFVDWLIEQDYDDMFTLPHINTLEVLTKWEDK